MFISIGNFQQVAHESRALTILRILGSCDIGQTDVVMCGLPGFLGNFHMVDIFPSRWNAPFHGLRSEHGNGPSAVNAH